MDITIKGSKYIEKVYSDMKYFILFWTFAFLIIPAAIVDDQEEEEKVDEDVNDDYTYNYAYSKFRFICIYYFNSFGGKRQF